MCTRFVVMHTRVWSRFVKKKVKCQRYIKSYACQQICQVSLLNNRYAQRDTMEIMCKGTFELYVHKNFTISCSLQDFRFSKVFFFVLVHSNLFSINAHSSLASVYNRRISFIAPLYIQSCEYCRSWISG